MTAAQFKEYTEALAENAILHHKIDKLTKELVSRKRENKKLREVINELRWESKEAEHDSTY